MPAARTKSLLPLLLSMLLLPVVCPGYAQLPKSRKHVVKPQAAPAPQPAPPPPVPLTPEQLPATLPQVSYRDNQLTIVAQNSTLSDILRAVRTQTGAVVEVPANANERVVAHLGPGPARDVLAALLNGSHFDYVMLGSAANPSAVERVILTSKTGPATPNATPVYQAAIQQVAAPPDPSPSVEQPQEAEDGNDDEFANDTELEDEQAADAPAPTQGPLLPNGQPAGRTPEQLLQELQRQQQQLQQQGQGGQPAPQPPGGPTPPGQQPPPQQ